MYKVSIYDTHCSIEWYLNQTFQYFFFFQLGINNRDENIA